MLPQSYEIWFVAAQTEGVRDGNGGFRLGFPGTGRGDLTFRPILVGEGRGRIGPPTAAAACFPFVSARVGRQIQGEKSSGFSPQKPGAAARGGGGIHGRDFEGGGGGGPCNDGTFSIGIRSGIRDLVARDSFSPKPSFRKGQGCFARKGGGRATVVFFSGPSGGPTKGLWGKSWVFP